VLFFGLEPEHRAALADKIKNTRESDKGDG
jgi:hypothetical protein